MNFSYNQVWEDTVGLLRSHQALIVALAAAFIFLPNLLVDYFVPQPESAARDLQGMLNAINAYWQETWYWHLLALLINMVGSLSILILLFDRRRPTVGAAIAAALPILPFYVLATFLFGLIVLVVFSLVAAPLLMVGGKGPMGALAIVLAIVPAAYVYARMALIAPVVVAEDRRNPIDAIRRCFEITARRGWAVLGLLLLVTVAVGIPVLAISWVAGALFLWVLGPDLGEFLILVVANLLKAVLTTILILLVAALYRRLVAAPSAGAALQ